ncbi:MAG TPA: MerR family transcriptional regulator [Gemmatimonadaceae bacterium]|nr:MerR family transcriptional regulator [Gemmatimonadaceae bacterium]
MPKRSVAADSVHPIQVVSRRTGLSTDVIRAWEKRYAVVRPVRSVSGRRLYADADVERLRLLARATLSGRTIGQVAALSTAELEAVASEASSERAVTRADGNGSGRAPAAATAAADHLQAALDAVGRFDGVALDAALRRAMIALPAEGFLDAVVAPLWERVSSGTGDGALPAPHRHLALTTLRRTLHRVAEVAMTPLAAPELVVTTPSGQAQELGALLVAAAAAAEGWRVTYVGPGLAAEEIAETATHAGARAVVVSLGAVPGDRAIPRELRRLRALLPRDLPILVEGAAADAHAGTMREIRATVLEDLPTLRTRLRMLRGT